MPLLLPTTEEIGGVQKFIYRSVFPMTFSVTDQSRALDILFTDTAMRGKELDALLRTFGFSPKSEIETEQTATGHIIFRQRLLLVDLTRDSVVKYRGDTQQEDPAMCCRYFIDDTADELLPYFDAASQSSLTTKLVAKLGKPLITKGEVRPTNMVTGIALNKHGSETAFPMIWGYSVKGAKGPVFNARSESAAERPMFKEGWTNHRCIIPASFFFEWGILAEETGSDSAGQTKTKFAIQPQNEMVTWLAGLYRIEENNGIKFPAFTILTKEATGQMRRVHDRMPVMFRKDMISEWLSSASDSGKMVRHSLQDLVIEKVV